MMRLPPFVKASAATSVQAVVQSVVASSAVATTTRRMDSGLGLDVGGLVGGGGGGAVVAGTRRMVKPTREVAVALHDYCRDQVLYGFTDRFDLASTEHTLERRIGHGTVKAGLMVQMLRHAGFADANLVAVPIPSAMLLDPTKGGSGTILHRHLTFPSQTIQHCFTQVTVENVLCRFDSYVVDRPMFQQAQTRLAAAAAVAAMGTTTTDGGERTRHRHGPKVGYGIHRDGTCEWDGQSDAFCQYVLTEDDDHDERADDNVVMRPLQQQQEEEEPERMYSSLVGMVKLDREYLASGYPHANLVSVLGVPGLGPWVGRTLLERQYNPMFRALRDGTLP
jgi:hypothetical protein